MYTEKYSDKNKTKQSQNTQTREITTPAGRPDTNRPEALSSFRKSPFQRQLQPRLSQLKNNS